MQQLFTVMAKKQNVQNKPIGTSVINEPRRNPIGLRLAVFFLLDDAIVLSLGVRLPVLASVDSEPQHPDSVVAVAAHIVGQRQRVEDDFAGTA